MDFFDVVHARYSHKELFLPDAVPLADLEKIALAGLSAPNGVNRQLVRLVLLPDRTALAPLSDLLEHGGLNTAPAAIAVLTTDGTPPDGVNFTKEDYAAAVENMLLAAVALGYQSCWYEGQITDADNIGRKMADVLQVPEDYDLVCFLPIGIAAQPLSQAGKLPFEKRARFNGF